MFTGHLLLKCTLSSVRLRCKSNTRLFILWTKNNSNPPVDFEGFRIVGVNDNFLKTRRLK